MLQGECRIYFHMLGGRSEGGWDRISMLAIRFQQFSGNIPSVINSFIQGVALRKKIGQFVRCRKIFSFGQLLDMKSKQIFSLCVDVLAHYKQS
jgi:hypothetical protein